MRKSSLPVSFKTLLKYRDEGVLSFDSPVQRNNDQWSCLQKSIFIHSVLGDFIIPNIYLTKENFEGITKLSVLDGKQRLSTLISFIDDEFALHSKCPAVEVDGNEYVIASKKFSDLEDDLKSTIMQYRFGTYQLEDCTNEEIEETFARLNAGTSLSKIQTARPKMGVELAEFFNELVMHKFFQASLNLTLAQLRREDDLLMLITSAMLIENLRYNEFEIKTSASAAECVRFAEHIKDNYSDEKRCVIEYLIEYLDEAFGDNQYKFLRKNNVPIVMFVAMICMEHNVQPDDFNVAMNEFFDDVPYEYESNSGSGNVKMVKIRKRLSCLLDFVMNEFSDLFSDEEEYIVTCRGTENAEEASDGENIDNTIED